MNLPTVDDLYLHSQAQVVDLKAQIEDLQKRLNSAASMYKQLADEMREGLSVKDSQIAEWKKLCFSSLQELEFANENIVFWSHEWELADKEVRRLKKKLKKK